MRSSPHPDGKEEIEMKIELEGRETAQKLKREEDDDAPAA